MIEGHGGNIYKLAEALGCNPFDICDMSANVNPLGPMPALVGYLQQELQAIAVLPEVNASQIVRLFAQDQRLNPERVMAGNGTTELIYLIPRAVRPSKALIVGPTYADYEDACKMNRVRFHHWTCKEESHFVLDLQALQKAASEVDLVFLCNPNNPTGTLVSRSDLAWFCRSLPNTLVVVDESYLPFVPQSDEISLIGTTLSNVIVLNSMSKAFRIPGLRIGFAKADKTVLEKIRSYALPWSVNSLAQKAVSWLMNHPVAVSRFLEETRRLIGAQRSALIEFIESESQIRCFPSVTSFLLMRLPEGLSAPVVWRHMAKRHVLIRDCSNFEGLTEQFIRLSLKKEIENRKAANLLIRLDRERSDGC